MTKFTVWYDETYTYKMGFEAETKEEALELIQAVYQGDLDINELPGFWSKDKGYQIDIDPYTLEEIA